MSREDERLEQAKFYNDKGVKDPHIHFLRGSEWADSSMIDKACEWLEENMIDVGIRFIRGDEIKDIVDLFRKAMEGE